MPNLIRVAILLSLSACAADDPLIVSLSGPEEAPLEVALEDAEGVWFDIAHLKEPLLSACADNRMEFGAREPGTGVAPAVFECRRGDLWYAVDGVLREEDISPTSFSIGVKKQGIVPAMELGIQAFAKGPGWMIVGEPSTGRLFFLARSSHQDLAEMLEAADPLIDAGFVTAEDLYEDLEITEHVFS